MICCGGALSIGAVQLPLLHLMRGLSAENQLLRAAK